MANVLALYYAFVAFLCLAGIGVASAHGETVLAGWLFLAVFVNLFFFRKVRGAKAEKSGQK